MTAEAGKWILISGTVDLMNISGKPAIYRVLNEGQNVVGSPGGNIQPGTSMDVEVGVTSLSLSGGPSHGRYELLTLL